MPKFLMGSIVLLLLLGAAGYGITTLQARSIPWDCSDWQAFAHADRTTAILESLAENRGKTLYCGVDQSDTFTKAETWEAGKDRNERDDTVYFGERGQFRGFIAAQEGYLTDGESGVTGVSIDRIFEFPREERRRTKRVKRWDIANDADQFPITAVASCGQVGGIICTPWGNAHGGGAYGGSSIGASKREAIQTFLGNAFGSATSNWSINWQTQAYYNPSNDALLGRTARPSTEEWLAWATAAAKEVCRAQHGGQSVSNVAIGPGHSNDSNPHGGQASDRGSGLGWFFDNTINPNYRYRARASRTWTATCKKVIRRTRN